jgi:hypothetical protein
MGHAKDFLGDTKKEGHERAIGVPGQGAVSTQKIGEGLV